MGLNASHIGSDVMAFITVCECTRGYMCGHWGHGDHRCPQSSFFWPLLGDTDGDLMQIPLFLLVCVSH